MNYTPTSVIEGQSVRLCCSSDSRPPTTEILLDMESRVLSLKYDTDVLCHDIINISRADSGSYKCFAENEVGIENDEVIITVLCKYKITVLFHVYWFNFEEIHHVQMVCLHIHKTKELVSFQHFLNKTNGINKNSALNVKPTNDPASYSEG